LSVNDIGEMQVGAATYKKRGSRNDWPPLTYRPQIVIESTIDLPPEYGANVEGCFELAVFLVELALELLFSSSLNRAGHGSVPTEGRSRPGWIRTTQIEASRRFAAYSKFDSVSVSLLANQYRQGTIHMNTSQIDSAILSAVGEHWTKVAMVIATVVDAMSHDLPHGDKAHEVISRRIEALAHNGRLAAQGDTKNWRFNEIRLKPTSDRP
jgi:hypothetical protein